MIMDALDGMDDELHPLSFFLRKFNTSRAAVGIIIESEFLGIETEFDASRSANVFLSKKLNVNSYFR